jgi:sugar/nucleoside kinase (ribokinase family)
MKVQHDIVFIGHVARGEMQPFEGTTHIVAGAVQFSAMAAASWSNKKIAVITRAAEHDRDMLDEMRRAGIVIYVQPSTESTFMRVVHPTPDPDERSIYMVTSAGYLSIDELPQIEPCYAHLVGMTDQEFTIGYMAKLRDRGFTVSVDMQSFVRQVDRDSGTVYVKDVELKKDIAAMSSKVKLDVVEARVLTGSENLEDAGKVFESWGTAETLVTSSKGVLVRSNGRSYFEPYSNSSNAGRTGRGDSTFAAYLTYRIDHDIAASVKFAAALASIKMERPGVFKGSLQEILERVRACYS